MQRRALLAFGMTTALLRPRGAPAQQAAIAFNRPIRLIVPFPAGNTADFVARIYAEPLSRRVAQPVVVENRSGAGGIIGTEAAASAEPDGHTLLLTTPSPLVLNPFIYRTLPYDPMRDFAPIGRFGGQPMILLGSPRLPARTLPELVAHMRASSGRLAYASVGIGSYSHFAMELLLARIGASATHVPYRGAGAAQTDVIAGNVPLMIDALASGLQQVREGRLIGYGVTSSAPSPMAPEMPVLGGGSVAELAGYEVSGWVGLLAPQRTPATVLAFHQAVLNEALADQAFQRRLQGLNQSPYASSSAEDLRRAIAEDSAKWSRVAQDARLELRD